MAVTGRSLGGGLRPCLCPGVGSQARAPSGRSCWVHTRLPANLCLEAQSFDAAGREVHDPAVTRSARSTDDLAEAFLTASRVLVGLAVHSLAASPVDITLAQHRVLVMLASHG